MMETRKFKLIACEIIYREACRLAAICPHRLDVEFLRKGLHDMETPDMAATLQAAIDAVDPSAGYDAILLGYARCNDGVAGVRARTIPLVIPRAHDCITLFFGSRRAYKEYFDAHVGTYFKTTGWCERDSFESGGQSRPAHERRGVMDKLGLTESYEQLVARHGRDNADYIMQTLDWTRNYSHMLYLEMGTCDEAPFIARCRKEAKEKGWTFHRRKGEWSLLEKLASGLWDEDFVVVPPGARIVPRNDELILDTEP